MVLSHPMVMRDALNNADPGIALTKDDKRYAQGVIVGIVSTLMATGKSFDRALRIVKDLKPDIDPECLPELWRDLFASL